MTPTPTSFVDLVRYLEGPHGRAVRSCDHTLAKTRAWLAAHGHDVPAAVAYLEHLGAYCDCEVLFNAAQRLLDAGEEERA